MVTSDSSDTERKIVTILKVLSESSKPVGSTTIAREMERFGIRREAARRGVANLSPEAIDAEIAAARKVRRSRRG